MQNVQGSRLFVAACGVAALLSAGACNGNNSGNTAADRAANGEPKATAPADQAKATSGEAGRTAEQKQISLTGCLQKDGSNYIITQVNEPSKAPAAKGKATSGDKVEREQMNAARHAYRINDDRSDKNEDLDKLVGKQVRVSGMLTDQSGLMAKSEHEQNSVGTSGTQSSKSKAGSYNDRDREKIDSGDLARIDASSIDQVSEGCGAGHGAAKSGASKGGARRQ
jgi:hypothetical protein